MTGDGAPLMGVVHVTPRISETPGEGGRSL